MIGLLGSTGYVGRNMANALRKAGVEFVPILDYRMPDRWFPEFDEFTLDTVINCAGLADMDRAQWHEEYHDAMMQANAVGPIALRNDFRGYLVHISSPFAIGSIRSRYGVCKRIADMYLDMFPNNTLTVFPNRLYGGEGSRQLDALLQDHADKPFKVDNWHEFNPTPVEAFCDAVVSLIAERATGRVLVYGNMRATAVSFARNVLGLWCDQWQYTLYVDDAPRPMDICYQDRFADYRHVTLEVPIAALV